MKGSNKQGATIKAEKLLFVIIFAALLIRIIGVNTPLYTDEAHYTNIKPYFSSQYYVDYGLKPMEKNLSEQYFASKFDANPSISHHPPFSMALWAVSAFIFGKTSFAFRIVPLIFGLLSIFLVYLLAKHLYGEKAGLFSAALAAISFYSILSSLLVDVHGAIQMTMFLASVYFFLKHETSKETKHLIYSAVFAGLATLNSYTSIFLFAIITIYSLIKSRKMETFVKLLKFGAIAVATYSIFPILAFIFNRDVFLRTLITAGALAANINPRFLVFLGIWVGPLLLGLAALCLLKRRKEDLIFFIWIIVAATFCVFSSPNASLDRYFAVAVPAFIILAGRFLSEANLKDRHIYTGGIIFLLFYSLLLFLNLKNVSYLGHDLNNYIHLASSFKWNFFFPITGPVGPVFGVVFSSIAYSLIISVIYIVLSAAFITIKRVRLFRWALTIFIAVSLAFNVLLVEEYLIHAAHPDYNNAYSEAVNYYKANENVLPDKVYTNNRALFFCLNKTGLNLFSYTEETNARTKELIDAGNLTVILFNFPKIPDSEPIWGYLENANSNCGLKTTFYSKGQETGYVWVC